MCTLHNIVSQVSLQHLFVGIAAGANAPAAGSMTLSSIQDALATVSCILQRQPPQGNAFFIHDRAKFATGRFSAANHTHPEYQIPRLLHGRPAAGAAAPKKRPAKEYQSPRRANDFKQVFKQYKTLNETDACKMLFF